MPECLPVKRQPQAPPQASGPRAGPWSLFFALLAMISASSVAVAEALPPGGRTSWEIQELEAIVTFLIFDPTDPAVFLPTGLRFASASEVAVEFPELQDHLKEHPEHSDWAFSFVEFV